MYGPLTALSACLVAWTAAASAQPVTMNWTVDGVERQALVFAPPPATHAVKAPVVFGFHGHGGTMQTAAAVMAFHQRWPGAIVVYMQGLPTQTTVDPAGARNGWQREPGELGDRDLKFFDAVLATLHSKYVVDDRRIYASGFSNGAIFSLLLWGERGKKLAAIGVCAGIIFPSVTLTERRPVIHIAGQSDTVAGFPYQVQTMEKERRFNGCSTTPQSCGLGCELYPSPFHSPVMTIIHPGGHTIPPWTSARIIAFFKAHPLP